MLEVIEQRSEAIAEPRTGSGPLVSVIVPAFNCEKYIGDALASLIGQSLTDIEIIVVDDGSTDATASVVAKCARRDSRIRLIRRSTASGRPACARNVGLRAARGEYVALLDSDDVATPTRIASAISAMRTTGAGLAFADFRKVYERTGLADDADVLEGARFLKRAAHYLTYRGGDVYLCKPDFPAFLLTYTAVNTPTIVFRRELLEDEATWFDESIVSFEDVDLWFRLAARTQFVYINETHALNRRHASSLTASNPLATILDGIDVRKDHLKRLAPELSRAEVVAARQNIASLQWDVAYENWCANNRSAARRAFFKSWMIAPSTRAAAGFFKAFLPRDTAIAVLTRMRLVRAGRDRDAPPV